MPGGMIVGMYYDAWVRGPLVWAGWWAVCFCAGKLHEGVTLIRGDVQALREQLRYLPGRAAVAFFDLLDS